MATLTVSEMKARVMARAAQDKDFRAQLVADPAATLSAELGVSIPEEFTVKVHEDSATSAYLVLPPSPRLTAEDLVQVAGGSDWRMMGRDGQSSG